MFGMTTRWCLGVGMGGAIALGANCASAQITTDGTLPNNSIITPDGSTLNITGGTQAGSNLFHSFDEFSVPNGGTASFNNALDIQNIIGRVTGGSASKIDGLIRANGTANLFLINPSGIIFGRNASLNIGGSFVATTANALQFGNQGFFSADNPNTPPLLTVNPSAFIFNQIAAAGIQNNSLVPVRFDSLGRPISRGLRVPDNRSLLLVGGDISIDGGGLNTFNGRVELGGLAGAGAVGLNVDGNNLRLSFPSDVSRADISLTNQAIVDVRPTIGVASGSSITINAQNINILGGSGFLTSSGGTRAFSRLTLNATGTISIAGEPKLRINEFGYYVDPRSIIAGEDIDIQAKLFSVDNFLMYSTSTSVGAESIFINNAVLSVAGEIKLQGTSDISMTNALLDTKYGLSAGRTSGIALQAKSISLSDRVILNASNQGVVGYGREDPNSGNISLQASSISMTDEVSLGTDAAGQGNAGNILVQANSISMSNGASLSSSTFGQGKAGNIQVNASDSLTLSKGVPVREEDIFPSGLFTNTKVGSGGQGGNIEVNTGALRITDGAVLNAETRNAARGGNIIVNTNSLEVTSAGQLLTTASSSGHAGNITVNAIGNVVISGSKQFGEAIVNNDSSNSGLFARVRGDKGANAGNIEVNARSIYIDKGTITTETTLGEGGDITLNVRDILLLRNNSSITATAGTNQKGGNGGNITINAPLGFIVAVPSEDSDITANAYTGSGGRVDIQASGIYGIQPRSNPTSLSDITASSEFGVNGTVELNTPDIDPNSGLLELPTIPVKTEVTQGCYSSGYAQNRFVISGRGGLPLNPYNFLSPNAVLVDWVTLNPSTRNSKSPPVTINPTATPKPIVEATGWVINAKGELELTANAPATTPHGSWQNPVSCRAAS